MEYKEILKREFGSSCSLCYGSNRCGDWHEELGHKKGEITCNSNDHFFAHADQLKGLIEEAEAGAQKWVRDNTLFICLPTEPCSRFDRCVHTKLHKYDTGQGCFHKCHGTESCKPFRGTKGEPQKFNGIDKRVIESLIEECDAEAGTQQITESEYNHGKQFLKEKAEEIMNQAPAIQPKHIGIHGSIERLSEVNRKFGSLIEEIAGHPTPSEACNGIQEEPSLLEVLNGSGNAIAELSESINAKIEDLKALLF